MEVTPLINQLNLNISYDDELDIFILTYSTPDLDKEKLVFQVKMPPSSFENMTNDFIKIVKNRNLAKAKEYTESQNLLEKGECLNLGNGLPEIPVCEVQKCQNP